MVIEATDDHNATRQSLRIERARDISRKLLSTPVDKIMAPDKARSFCESHAAPVPLPVREVLQGYLDNVHDCKHCDPRGIHLKDVFDFADGNGPPPSSSALQEAIGFLAKYQEVDKDRIWKIDDYLHSLPPEKRAGAEGAAEERMRTHAVATALFHGFCVNYLRKVALTLDPLSPQSERLHLQPAGGVGLSY